VLVTRVSPAKTAEPIEMPFGHRLAWAQGTVYLMKVDMGATWRIRLNDPCSAAMWSVTIITVATYFSISFDYYSVDVVAFVSFSMRV